MTSFAKPTARMTATLFSSAAIVSIVLMRSVLAMMAGI